MMAVDISVGDPFPMVEHAWFEEVTVGQRWKNGWLLYPNWKQKKF